MMRRIAVVQCWVLALLLMAASVYAADALVTLVERVRPAVVTVIGVDDSGERVTGSGFLVGKDEVVTCWHVAADADKIKIVTVDEQSIAVTGVTSGDESSDVAILKLKTPVKNAKPLKVVSTPPKQGERVIVIASPRGFLGSSVSDGIVSAMRSEDGMCLVQITAPVSPGSSGGPVLNMKGEVIGVVRHFVDGQNLNFAICGKSILALKPGVVNRTAKAGAPGAGPAKQDIFTRATDLYATKQWLKALPVLLEIVKKDPKNHVAWSWIGDCNLNTGNFGFAIDAYKESIELKPSYIPSYTGLGLALQGLGKYPQAELAFRTAIALDPTRAFPHYCLGMLYVAAGKAQSASDELVILEKLDATLAAKLKSAAAAE